MSRSKLAALILYAVAAFQISLVLGAPFGDLTQGGVDSGTLETPGRVTAAVSVILLVLMAQVTLAVDGLGWFGNAKRRLVRVLAWVAAAYSVLSVLLNAVSPSLLEKLLWVPVTLIIGYLQISNLRRTKGKR